MRKWIGILTVFGVLMANLVTAQVYLKDLQNGDLASVEKKFALLGTSFSKEPVLFLYLSNSNADPKVVKALIDKGASVTQASPKQKIPPLFVAIINKQSQAVINILINCGAKLDTPFHGPWGKNIIEYALRDQQFRVAAYLLHLNNNTNTKDRLKIDKNYKNINSILLDNVDQTKKIMASEGLTESFIWKLAIAGQSKNVIKFLLSLNSKPVIERDDLLCLGMDHDLFNFAFSAGFVPTGSQLIELYQSDPKLFAILLKNDEAHILSLTGEDSFERQKFWDRALENEDTPVLMAMGTLDSEIASDFLKAFMKKQPDTFIAAADHGLKITDADELWDAAFELKNINVFKKLLTMQTPPGDVAKRAQGYDDGVFVNLLSAGYGLSPKEIQWEDLIKNSHKDSLKKLLELGFNPPKGSLLGALAIDEEMFLMLLGPTTTVSQDDLGNAVISNGDNKSDIRLVLDVAIEKGFLKALKVLDERCGLLNTEYQTIDPATFPWDYIAKRDPSRDRKVLKYFDVFRNGEERGYGPDGYNDFLTNNFSALTLLIALKNDQIEIAKYVLSRNPNLRNYSVFSGQGMKSYSNTPVKFTIQAIGSRYYSSTAAIRALE